MINAKALLQKIESGDVSYEDKLAALSQVETALKEMRDRKETVLNDRVGLIITALKNMQDKVAAQLEEAKAIVPEVGPAGPKGEPGERGLDGSNGRDGRDGVDGRNGVDGVDGISVTDAHIDFDGSLIITLSSGQVINVGEVVTPDLAEKIRVINTMSTNTAIAAITGGTIDNTIIGGTTPSAGTFTTLTATGQTSLGGDAGSESLRVLVPGATGNYWQFEGSSGDVSVRPNGASSNIGTAFINRGSGNYTFATGTSAGTVQTRIAHTASAVNYVQVTGAATGLGATISAQGSDANVGLALRGKGSGFISIGQDTTTQFAVSRTSSAVNYFLASGGISGNAPTMSAFGSDTNISQVFQSKGTGAIDLAAGSSGVNISNGTTVTAITRTAAGLGYTSVPTTNISAPTTAGGVQAVISIPSIVLASPALNVGGTGYTVGDVLTLVGGTFTTAATVTVTAVSSGVITAVAISNNGVYTVAPATPISVTGGTGTGAAFNSSFGINSNFTITNAGSGYVEQPTVTFSGGGGSGAAAYASVGGTPVIKSLAGGSASNGLTFANASGNVLNLVDGLVASPAQVNIRNSGNAQIYASSGTLVVSGGTGSGGIGFYSNGVTVQQFGVAHTASAVNYVQVTGAATGGRPTISAQGSDTNLGLGLTTKGNGRHVFFNNNSTTSIQFSVGLAGTSTAVNYLNANGTVATTSPELTAEGTDTNLDIRLTPKGTGNVRFGTLTASADVPITGYIQIKDSSGTIRKLAVIA